MKKKNRKVKKMTKNRQGCKKIRQKFKIFVFKKIKKKNEKVL